MSQNYQLIWSIASQLYARAAWVDHSSTAKISERDEHNRRQAAECLRAARIMADVLDPRPDHKEGIDVPPAAT